MTTSFTCLHIPSNSLISWQSLTISKALSAGTLPGSSKKSHLRILWALLALLSLTICGHSELWLRSPAQVGASTGHTVLSPCCDRQWDSLNYTRMGDMWHCTREWGLHSRSKLVRLRSSDTRRPWLRLMKSHSYFRSMCRVAANTFFTGTATSQSRMVNFLELCLTGSLSNSDPNEFACPQYLFFNII